MLCYSHNYKVVFLNIQFSNVRKKNQMRAFKLKKYFNKNYEF